MPDFKPSQVALVGVPLVGTLGRTEIEFAAACIIHASQVLGDEWKPVSWMDLSGVMRKELDDEKGYFRKLLTNPFLRPDFFGLVAAGFATKTGDEAAPSFALTPLAFERIQKWVRA